MATIVVVVVAVAVAVAVPVPAPLPLPVVVAVVGGAAVAYGQALAHMSQAQPGYTPGRSIDLDNEFAFAVQTRTHLYFIPFAKRVY